MKLQLHEPIMDQVKCTTKAVREVYQMTRVPRVVIHSSLPRVIHLNGRRGVTRAPKQTLIRLSCLRSWSVYFHLIPYNFIQHNNAML